MDTTFVANFPKIAVPDTIQAKVTNLPEKISVPDEVMAVCDSLQTQIAESNTKLDVLYQLLMERGTEGWGINQILAIAAIPLIIAIFAFTFPLLSNAISKIEKTYRCEEISKKLENSLQMWLYKISLLVCMAALVFLIIFPSQTWIFTIFPYLTLLLVACVFLYNSKVRDFEKPLWVVGQLEKWYSRDYKKTKHAIARKEFIWKCQSWLHKKNPLYQRMYRTYRGLNNVNPYRSAEHKFYERLYALLNIAVDTDNPELFYAITGQWDNCINQLKLRSFQKQTKLHWHFNGADELFVFFQHTIALLGACSEPRYQDAVVNRLNTTLNHSLMPWESDVMLVLRALVFLPRENGVTMVRRYINRADWMYRSLLRIPQIAYVGGAEVENKKERELECRKEWMWIQNIHFLLAAYWWNKGGYGIVQATCPDKTRKYPFELFPVSCVDVLYQYICALHAMDSASGGISGWEVEELFDIKKEEMRKIVINYATFLMYFTARRDKTYYSEAIGKDILEKIGIYISEIEKNAEDKKVLLALDMIHYDYSNIDVIKLTKQACQLMLQDIQDEEYNKPINAQICEQLKQSLEDSKHIIRSANTEGIYRDDNRAFDSKILLNRCSLKMDKPFFTQNDVDDDIMYQVSRNIGDVVVNRYLYAWRTAVEQMNIEEKVCDALHFNEEVVTFTKGAKNDYVLISFESPFETLLYSERSTKEYLWLRMSKHNFSFCDKTQLFVENDKVVYVIRKEDLPTLQYVEGCEKAEFSIKDESSLKEGELTVRFEIDPHLVLRFKKSAKILKIRHKKMQI